MGENHRPATTIRSQKIFNGHGKEQHPCRWFEHVLNYMFFDSSLPGVTISLEATFPYSENLRIPCFHRTPDLGFGMLL
jgi:hypothetical protein